MGLSIQKEKFKIDFQDSNYVFPIRTILAFLDLQIILMLSTNF